MKLSLIKSIFRIAISVYICSVSPALADDRIVMSQDSLDNIERRNTVSILYSEEAKYALTSAGYTIDKRNVERGETWESIAAQYNVTVELLKGLNSGYDECLVGIELYVPIAPDIIANTDSNYTESDMSSLLYYARHNLEMKEYKKAVKEYDRTIKEHPSIEAYYERAFAQYKRGKLKQAISDLKQVQRYQDYDTKYPDADELLAGINEEWSMKKAQRAEMWGQIVGAVLTTGLEIGNAYLQAKHGSPTWSSTENPFAYGQNFSCSNPNFSSPQTSYFTNGVDIPDCLKIENYLNPQMTMGTTIYDQSGNPMYSNVDLANAMKKMNSDFAGYMYNSGLFNTGPIGNSLLGSMTSMHTVNNLTADMIATPSYSISDSTTENNSFTSGNKHDSFSSADDNKHDINYSPQVLSYVNTYDDYVSVLIGMKSGTVTYDRGRIQRSQTSMKEIREKLKTLDFNLPKSQWEDWDGSL